MGNVVVGCKQDITCFNIKALGCYSPAHAYKNKREKHSFRFLFRITNKRKPVQHVAWSRLVEQTLENETDPYIVKKKVMDLMKFIFTPMVTVNVTSRLVFNPLSGK